MQLELDAVNKSHRSMATSVAPNVSSVGNFYKNNYTAALKAIISHAKKVYLSYLSHKS